ncbi:MAG: mechanosensitive ion channel family protein [Hyphomonas sp.]
MDWILSTVDTNDWPSWAQASWPHGVKWGLVLASIIFIWIVAKIVKSLINAFGRRVSENKASFEGSSWDFGASVARFGTMFILLPLPLGIIGYDWQSMVESRGPGVVAAIITILFAIVIANWTARSMRSMGQKARAHRGADDTLFAFAASLVKYVIFAIALVIALTQVGFSTTSMAALLGGAALAIGLALQDTLKAVAAGVMLAVFRPFRIGDYVELGGIDGEVTDITPFTTSLKQVDNKVAMLTNDTVWSNPKINFTRMPQRRLDLYFDVSYSDNLDHALAVLRKVAEDDELVLANDDIWVGVDSLGDWSVKLRLRAYCATSDFLGVKSALTKGVKEAFDANGITIPFPHQVEIPYRDTLPNSSALPADGSGASPSKSEIPDD